MIIALDPSFESVLRRLEHAQGASGERVFIGTVRVEFRGEVAHISREETAWETASGEAINLSLLRDSGQGVTVVLAASATTDGT
jgi:hypothetical protein